jgi:signal transduction histidine kinase
VHLCLLAVYAGDMERLDVLASIIQQDHDVILNDWKNRVRQLPSAQGLDRLTLEDNFRSVLDEISNSLCQYRDSGSIPSAFSSIEHGRQRFEVGFDINEVAIEYSMLRQSLRECAARHGVSVDGVAGAVLHQLIDEEIAAAIAAHSRYQAARHEADIQERLADVVHNLKTPLSAIHTASHILEHRLSPESRQAVSTMLSIILRNCEHLNLMLTKLLEDTPRNETVLPSALNTRGGVDLHLLVADVIDDLYSLTEKTGVPILNEVPPDVHLKGDPLLLKQVLQNLLSNAVKYTNHGQILVGGSQDSNEVRFWVKDTGTGIAEDRLPHIFNRGEGDPFRQGSSGLGLAIVKKIVDAHQGRIRVESQAGEGSVFTVSLPQ